eukprot:TRINITY_DN2983_c0_g1_i1.p3 TRINITY_DN2983_c0_g1~~TRINITY_DN2983_c0_g1_i1.p3  ORF type:complete len:125 (+),score=15.98 TRINITY_DN2983_c0_g1_i1:410-784(+)
MPTLPTAVSAGAIPSLAELGVADLHHTAAADEGDRPSTGGEVEATCRLSAVVASVGALKAARRTVPAPDATEAHTSPANLRAIRLWLPLGCAFPRRATRTSARAPPRRRQSVPRRPGRRVCDHL